MSRPPLHPLHGIGALLALGALLGCSRTLYRQKADRDVYSAIRQKAEALDLSDSLLNPSIEPDPASRFFDPSDPNHPPMPPDDPASHQLLLSVDGKSGPETWRHPGSRNTPPDAPWRALLQQTQDGSGAYQLNLKSAMRLALLHSRDFQREKEDLYLSALDVTFERFRFSPRFALGNTSRAQADGRFHGGPAPGAASSAVLTDGSVRWLSATGGELLAGFANSFVWSFSGKHGHDTASSLVNFSLVQPLLRLGGRAQTLERLSQAERTLLANVRQMEQFQNGFYVRVIAGRNSGEGPSRSGNVGGSGLGLLAGTPSGRTGTPSSGGFLALLETQQRLANQEGNLARLRQSLDQLSAAFDAGRLSSRLQVDQARQALLSAQSNLLAAKAAFQTQLDAYKVDLGLPPEVPVAVSDPLFDRLKSTPAAATALDRSLAVLLLAIRNREIPLSLDTLQTQLQSLQALETPFANLLALAQSEHQTLRQVLPERKALLQELRNAPETSELSIDSEPLDPANLDRKFAQFAEQISQQTKDLSTLSEKCRSLQKELPRLALEEARSRLIELGGETSGLLLAISLNQTAIRLESAVLPRIDLSEKQAIDIARSHRLDWMNARARLVDMWRQVDQKANALQSGLTLSLSGSMGTLGSNQPASFDARTGSLQASLRFDSPLNRLAERNDYREAQIDYQRARRDYMLFEDRVTQSLRNTLRIARLGELNFELRRAAVQIAISQVELASLRLDEPPRPGATPQFGATTARDLVSALADLLDAQNDFLSLRVGYDVLRLVLDFELGTMRTNAEGLWVDPGALTGEKIAAHLSRWHESSSDQELLAKASPAAPASSAPKPDAFDTASSPSGASPPSTFARLSFRHAAPSVR